MKIGAFSCHVSHSSGVRRRAACRRGGPPSTRGLGPNKATAGLRVGSLFCRRRSVLDVAIGRTGAITGDMCRRALEKRPAYGLRRRLYGGHDRPFGVARCISGGSFDCYPTNGSTFIDLDETMALDSVVRLMTSTSELTSDIVWGGCEQTSYGRNVNGTRHVFCDGAHASLGELLCAHDAVRELFGPHRVIVTGCHHPRQY